MAVDLSDPQVGDLSSRIRGGLRLEGPVGDHDLHLTGRDRDRPRTPAHPRDFGIAGMALVIANLVVTFADIGVGTALGTATDGG